MAVKTLEQLDNEIAELRSQQLADLLRQREQLLHSKNGAGGHVAAPAPALTGKRNRKQEKSKITPSSEKLLKFFGEHGPAARGEIIEHSGIPAGTISSLLNKKELFEQGTDKKWRAKEK